MSGNAVSFSTFVLCCTSESFGCHGDASYRVAAKSGGKCRNDAVPVLTTMPHGETKRRNSAGYTNTWRTAAGENNSETHTFLKAQKQFATKTKGMSVDSDFPTIPLETERLTISPIQTIAPHAELLIRLYPPADQTGPISVIPPEKIDKTLGNIQGLAKRFEEYGHGIYVIALKTDARLIGCVSLMRGHYTVPDIGFALLPQDRRKGYAREAATRVIAYATSNLGYSGVLGFSDPDNKESRRVQEALGMEYRGVYALEAFEGKESAVFAMKDMGDLAQYGIVADTARR